MSLVTEADMALSNAERQTRWRNRLKEAAAAAADPDQVSENAALRARVATLEGFSGRLSQPVGAAVPDAGGRARHGAGRACRRTGCPGRR